MKKLALTFFSTALILGASTAAFAEEDNDGRGTLNYGQMKPMMEKMHPGFSEKELKQMYNDCHGTMGAMPSKNFEMMDGGHKDIVD
jgi:Ca2+-binding EF-hand superfamily protein